MNVADHYETIVYKEHKDLINKVNNSIFDLFCGI